MPVTIGDIGADGTTANFIGNTSWNDPRPTEQVDDFRIYGYALSAEQVVELFEGEVNAAPVGVADDYTTPEGETLVVDAAEGVLVNDTDAEDDDLTAEVASQPANGAVTLEEDGSFTYVPDSGFSGDDTFTYTASDGTTSSAPTTVTIAVEERANTAPVAVDDAFTTVEGEPLALAAPGVLGNDTDVDGDDLSATGLSQPVNGSVSLEADGSFTYTPDAGFAGKDQFTYEASDGTATSAPATVTITVKSSGGPGGPATSAVAGASLPFTYGQAGTVVVSVAPAAATGKVELASGSQVLSSATLASGQASLAVPAKSLLPGTHQLTLRYLGDDAHKPSSSQVQVTVEKVVPTMRVKAPDRIKRGAKAKVKVKVRAADGVPVTGRVRVAIKGGKTITASLDGGKAVVRLPKAAKGKLKLTITYLGSDLAEQVVDKVTIKVRR
jgi:VCBS repeat-containing protein